MLSHRQQLFVTLVLIVAFFAFLAKIDYVMGQREYLRDKPVHLPFLTIGQHWFWLWVIGYPFFAFLFAFTYYAGASDTERNFWYAVGIFLTVMLLAFGQLEDFLYIILNGFSFPAGEWGHGWTRENNLYMRLFGTWTAQMHFIWLGSFIILTIVMWIIIFEWT